MILCLRLDSHFMIFRYFCFLSYFHVNMLTPSNKKLVQRREDWQLHK
jgi:hypothetical protein